MISFGSFIKGLHAYNGVRPMKIYVCFYINMDLDVSDK